MLIPVVDLCALCNIVGTHKSRHIPDLSSDCLPFYNKMLLKNIVLPLTVE